MALHLFLASQTEPVQSFVGANVAEHRFHHGHAVAVYFFASWAVDTVLHPIRVVGQALVFDSERDLSAFAFPMVGGLRVLHALMLLRTVSTLQQTALEVGPALAILVGAGGVVFQAFACRTDASQVHRIKLELTGRDGLFPARVWQVLMPLAVFVFLVVELRIPAAELVVRHVTVNPPFVQVFHVGFIGEASVSSDHSPLLIDVFDNAQLFIAGFDGFQYRLQGVVFLTFTEGLGVDDDLVFLIHRGDPVVALDRAFAGGHLGAFVIGDVALHFLAPFPPAHPWAVRL